MLFLLVGGAVAFIAFSGGPGAAREAYLTRGRTFFRIAIPVIYIGLGIAIPAVVIADGEAKQGNQGALANTEADRRAQGGQGAVPAARARPATRSRRPTRSGVTGPNLDEIGLDSSTPEARKASEERIVAAIKNGGTGERRMPANLLQGEDAEAVAAYVADVAGR